MKAFDENRPLLDILLKDERVMSKVSEEEVRKHMEPLNYVGLSAQFVDRAVEKWGNI